MIPMKYRPVLAFVILLICLGMYPINGKIGLSLSVLLLYDGLCARYRLPFYTMFRRMQYWMNVEPSLFAKLSVFGPLIAYPMAMALTFKRDHFRTKFIELGAKEFVRYVVEYADKIGTDMMAKLNGTYVPTPEEQELIDLKRECDETEGVVRKEQWEQRKAEYKAYCLANKDKFVHKASNKRRKYGMFMSKEEIAEYESHKREAIKQTLAMHPLGKPILERLNEEDDLNNTLKEVGIERPKES
jgi:hypothetical protein